MLALYWTGVGLGFGFGVLVTLWCVGFLLVRRKRRRRALVRILRP